ncbi:MAG: hypothetical protein EA370_00195 [Wenzhouxiangella sp.]|nr:MAG: hypothetical protein EA370_00195 [Wenzhouxiangella sp.]
MKVKLTFESPYALGHQVFRRLAEAWPALAFLVLLVTAATVTEEDKPDAELNEAIALETFDQVWEQVRAQYFDFQRIESDWDAARERLRPLAGQAQDIAALRLLLHELLDLIGESHFGIFPAEAFEQLASLEVADVESSEAKATPGAPGAATGLSVRLVEGAVRVSEVRAESRASKAGIRPGWKLVTVDELDLGPILKELADTVDEADHRRSVTYLEYALLARLTFTRADREIELTFLDAAGNTHQQTLTGEPLEHGAVQIGNLPPMTFEFSLERVDTANGCASVVRFSSWVPAVAEKFRQRRDEVFECKGLVFDLRGNPGGVLPIMVTVATDLFEQPEVLGTLLRRDGHIDFRVLPRRVAMDGTRLSPFAGPVAIMIDGMTGSTSEMFAAGMQATGRARLFGERSAGMALPSQMLPLASGDFMMYAFADYHDSLGRRIEGVGVQPDKPIRLTEEKLGYARPPALQAALDWITSEVDQ